MLNIFFISNDERLEKFIEHMQPFFKTRIRLVSDFDHGLKDLFANRPSLVFIQGQIGNVSGETVASHVKSLLGAASPKIILLSKTGLNSENARSCYDDSMPIYDSEPEFQAAFQDRIKKFFPEFHSEVSNELSETQQSPLDSMPEAPGGEEPLVSAICIPAAGQGGDGVEVLSAQIVEANNKPAETVINNRLSKNEENMSRKTDFSTQKIVVENEVFDQEFFPTAHDFPCEKKPFRIRSLQFIFALLLITFVIYSVYYLMFLKGNIFGNASKHVSTGSSPGVLKSRVLQPKQKIVFKGLPSFIQAEWRDLQYTVLNPGWERYVSSDLDFRVFRENGAIKALQVIFLRDPALSENFLSSVLKEFGCAGSLKAENLALKGGFLIEKVTVNGPVELVTYRKEADRKLTAFVLAFT